MTSTTRPEDFDVTTQLQSMLQAIETIASHLGEVDDVIGGLRIPKLNFEQQRTLIESLPLLTEPQLKELKQHDASCPICLTPYLAIVAESEMAEAMDSPAHPIEELGVTRLSQSWQCGHMFCRKDITKWIRAGNDSCPLCRRLLIDPSTRPAPSTTSETPSNPTSTDNNATNAPNHNPTPPNAAAENEEDGPDEDDTIENILREFNSRRGGDGQFPLGGIGMGFFGSPANRRDRDRDDDIDRDYSAMYS